MQLSILRGAEPQHFNGTIDYAVGHLLRTLFLLHMTSACGRRSRGPSCTSGKSISLPGEHLLIAHEEEPLLAQDDLVQESGLLLVQSKGDLHLEGEGHCFIQDDDVLGVREEF